MSDTNTGNQLISFKYKHATDNMNTLLNDILQPAIYKGGLLSQNSGIISIAEFSAIIAIGSYQSIICHSSGTLTLPDEADSTTPYICANYTWASSADNYLDFEYKSGIAENDICFGKGEFSGTTLTGFSYTEKSYPFRNLDDNIIRTPYIKSEFIDIQGGLSGLVSNSGLIITARTPVNSDEIATTGYFDSLVTYGKLNLKNLTDDYTIEEHEARDNYYFSNENATKDITIYLPSAEEGLKLYAINSNDSNYDLIVRTNYNDYIKYYGVTYYNSISGVINLNNKGDHVQLNCISTDTWIPNYIKPS